MRDSHYFQNLVSDEDEAERQLYEQDQEIRDIHIEIQPGTILEENTLNDTEF